MTQKLSDQAVQVHYVKGYASLASFITSDPDHSTAIYRRFDRLFARNLLVLQSELIELEAQQDDLDAEDLNPKTSTREKESARDLRVLKIRASQEGNVRERVRLQLLEEIRSKIQQYSIT